MSRDDELEPILRPWMQRNAPDAPSHLLLRVMREVDSMSERERTRSRSWLNLFGASPATGWVLATAAVAVLAIAVGLFIVNLPLTPTGTTASPTPTPTPVVTPAPTGAALVDRVTAAWNSGDGVATKPLYASNSEVRIAVESSTWTETHVGRDAISATVIERVPYHFTVTRTGEALALGDLLAFPFTWTATNGNGQGICVYQLSSDGLILGQYCFGESVAEPSSQATTPSAAVRTLVTDMIGAMNAGEAARVPEFFPSYAEWRSWVNGNDWGTTMLGRDEIASTWSGLPEIGFTVSPTGSLIQQGSFVAYAATISTTDGSPSPSITVLRLNTDNQIEYAWAIGTGS